MSWRLLKWLWGAPEPGEFVAAAVHAIAKGRLRKRTAYSKGPAMGSDNVIFLETPKDPQSEEVFNFTPGPNLIAGDSIASVLKCFVSRGDSSLVLLTAPAISTDGSSVSVKLGGGRLGVRYRVTLRFTTTLGETLDMSLEFDCRAA
jgi:hypothetical protein